VPSLCCQEIVHDNYGKRILELRIYEVLQENDHKQHEAKVDAGKKWHHVTGQQKAAMYMNSRRRLHALARSQCICDLSSGHKRPALFVETEIVPAKQGGLRLVIEQNCNESVCE
jgi:hypothetical protein